MNTHATYAVGMPQTLPQYAERGCAVGVDAALEICDLTARKSSLLVLDDLFILALDAKEGAALLGMIEDRRGRKSMIVASQIPADGWYDAIGAPTFSIQSKERLFAIGLC